jgi:hypothetical protein
MPNPSGAPDDPKPDGLDQQFSPPAEGARPDVTGTTDRPAAWDLARQRGAGELAETFSRIVKKRRSFEFSSKYRPSIRWCLCLQGLFFLLTAMLLDLGRANQFCSIAIVGQWVGIFLVMGRRPLSPTRADLLFIRYGIVPLMFATPYIGDWVWGVIGKSSQSGLERWLSIKPR